MLLKSLNTSENVASPLGGQKKGRIMMALMMRRKDANKGMGREKNEDREEKRRKRGKKRKVRCREESELKRRRKELFFLVHLFCALTFLDKMPEKQNICPLN